MRFIPLIIAVVFLLFSIVQLNDPDPLVWIGIYGFVCIGAVLTMLRKIHPAVLLIPLPFYLAGSVYLWPGTYEGITMSMGYKPGIEEARESLGLLIACISLVVLFFIARKNKS